MPSPLLVVDGPSLLYRAFFALPDSITDDQDQPVNALLGMTNVLLWVIERRRPRATVLCFGLEAATYRQELYPPYHADRPPVPDGLAGQFAQVEDFFGAFGFHVAGTDEFEADDLLGALRAGRGGRRRPGPAADRRPRHVPVRHRGRDRAVREDRLGRQGPGGGRARRGGQTLRRAPEAVPDFIALRGDPSDGLPGAKGIGEKTAADLLRRHGSLEAVIDGALRERPGIRKAIFEHADQLRAYREIATLRPVDVQRPPDTPVDWERAAEAARERGMNRLAERLDKEGG